MNELVEFLRARMDEEQGRVDTIPDWSCTLSARGSNWGSRGDCPLCGKGMLDGPKSWTADDYWKHVEDAHRRTYVLADVASKRRIVDTYLQYHAHVADFGSVNTLVFVMRVLALPYAAHPDYRQEWAV